jgi:hypothetical protein
LAYPPQQAAFVQAPEPYAAESGALRRVLEDSGAKLFQRPVSKNCADFGLAIEQ